MKSKVMAIPHLAIGFFLLGVIGHGIYVNDSKIEFGFDAVATIIIFTVLIINIFTDAYKKLRGKE